ncbi:hypothetical protein NITMOv2_4424 [Nitrospira moscoviensis]|uniref:Uncharacterized protein n=1 Tax=Nitrospira moscoviensis TaxID=42253 RepID=A0A0K2GIV4_NITMO|nr:hypothetical protein NITMOv2_4424 [Nitrospira moscoviensis]
MCRLRLLRYRRHGWVLSRAQVKSEEILSVLPPILTTGKHSAREAVARYPCIPLERTCPG